MLLVLLAGPAQAGGADFYATTCSSCHGEKGAGDGPAAASLPVKPADFTDPAFWAERDDATVAKAIREGGAAVGKSPMMAPFGAGLSEQEMAELVAFLKTLKAE